MDVIARKRAKQALAEIALLDGAQVELQKSATAIQWRKVGDPGWSDLVPLEDITGPQGIPGLVEPGHDYLLDVHTYDGQPSLTHPSVVFVPDGWNGYRYWMAFTPWPGGAREHASICASHDGQTWVSTMGQDNRIFPTATQGYATFGASHGSDPHLLLVGDELWCYHRLARSDAALESIVLQTSSDGVTWSDAVEVVRRDTGTLQLCLSPAVERAEDGSFVMYVVADNSDQLLNRTVQRRTSPDGLTWSAPETCTIPARLSPWHIDVKRVGSRWHMLVNDGGGSIHGAQQLVHLESADGLTWRGDLHPVLSHPYAGTGYYRSAFLPVPGDPVRWDVWASLIPENPIPTTGETEGKNPWRLAHFRAIDLSAAAQRRDAERLKAFFGQPPYVVADSFARADNVSALGSAATGQAWTVSTGTMGIKDRAAYAPSGNAVATIDSGLSDCIIEAVLDAAVDQPQEAWLVFRSADGKRLRCGFSATISKAGQTYRGIALQKIDGAVTSLAVAEPFITGDTLAVRLQGDQITVYRNGRQVISATDALNQTATVHGIQTNSADARIRAFSVRAL